MLLWNFKIDQKQQAESNSCQAIKAPETGSRLPQGPKTSTEIKTTKIVVGELATQAGMISLVRSDMKNNKTKKQKQSKRILSLSDPVCV